MLGRTISLRILFLLAVPGSLAGPSLTPAPLFYLDVASHPPAQGDTVKLMCIAPRGYEGSEFWLLRTGQAQPVQMLFASEAQHNVTFILGNITHRDAGQYKCCYHSYNGSARQASQLSNMVQIEVAGSTWLLPVTLGVAGVLLLSVGLVVAVVAVRRVNSRRRQLKRDQDSCWTERNFPTTDMSFDNCLFTVSVWTWQPRAAKMPASPQVPGQGSTPLPLWRAASSARSGLCSDGPGGGWLPLLPLPTPVPALASTSVLLWAGSLLTRGAVSGG
ncbi:protein HIDE1 isoform X3 [Pelodiscus sinensis]